MSRNIRTFSSISRTLFQSPSSFVRQNGPVNVQRVKIVRPFLTKRTVQKAALWMSVVAVVYYRLDFLLEDDDEEEDEEERKRIRPVKEAAQQVRVAAELEKLGGEGGEAAGIQEQPEQKEVEEVEGDDNGDEGEEEDDLVPEEMPEDAWFIPLTWPKRGPQIYYKGSDPEWQSFVAFSRDQSRAVHVKEELAHFIGRQISLLPPWQKFLGIPVSAGRYMLAIDFPDGPPPEHERLGIEITDDYVALTVRPIDQKNLYRLWRAIWPVATGSSLWASCGALWQIQMKKIRKAFKAEPPDSQQQQRFPDGYTNLSRILGEGFSKSRKAGETATEVTETKSSSASSAPANPKSPDRPWILSALPSIPEPSTDLSKATSVFRRSIAKNWRPTFPPPPRGTFLITGLVEVWGPSGIATLDVRATYDPQESRFVGVALGVKRVQKRKQKPKG